MQSWIALHIGALILIILLFLVYIFNRVSYYTQAYQSLGQEVGWVESLNQKLFGQLEQSNQMVYHQLINKTSDQNAARRRLWEQKIQPTLDSIQVLSASWLSAELKLKLADLDLSFKKLRKDQDVIEKLVGEEIENQYFLEGDITLPNPNASVSSITIYNRNLIDLINLIHKQFNEFRYLRQREYTQRGEELSRRTQRFWLYTGVLGLALLGLTFYTGLSIRQKIWQGLHTVRDNTRQLRRGQVPEVPLRSEREVMPILEDLQQIGFNLSQIQQIGKNVREGQLDRKIEVFSPESELGQTLSAMQDDLKRVGQRDFQRNWVNEGLTLFGNLLREYNDTQNLYDQLNATLVRYLKANQGGIFILDEKNERRPVLELKSVYAFERTRYHEKSVLPGQGLVGQAWKEKEVIYIEETEANFIQISSGLGGAQPRSVLIVPMVNNEAKVLGVLEIASFQRFAEYEIDFARRVAEMIVSAISAIKNNEKNRVLLAEAQRVTEQMRLKEEEMRKNLIKLMSTQEEMHRSQSELSGQTEAVNATLATLELSMDGKIQKANLALAQKLFYESETELLDQPYENLLPASERNAVWVYDLWEHLRQGDTYRRDIRLIDKNGQEHWFSATFTPIKNRNLKPFRVIFMALDITLSRQTILDYQGKLEAIQRSSAVIEFDTHGFITHVNERYLQLLHYTAPELLGKHHSVLVPEEDRESDEYINFWDRLARGESTQGRFCRLTKTHKRIWIWGSFGAVQNQEGKTHRIINVAHDITRQIEAETELQNQLLQAQAQQQRLQERIEQLQMQENELRERVQQQEKHKKQLYQERQEAIHRLEMLKSGLVMAEFLPDGSLLNVGGLFSDLLGYNAEEIRGMSFLALQGPQQSLAAQDNLWQKLRNGQIQTLVQYLRHKQGHEVPVFASLLPMVNTLGETYKIIQLALPLQASQKAALEALSQNV
ncbi:MAG: hypothetical protein OHK0053_17260 [Microscillaceae bacterium]